MACTYYGKHFGDNQNAVTEEGDASGRPNQFFNNFMHENGSFLSFDQADHPVAQGVHDPNSSSSTSNSQLLQDFGCVQSTSSYGYMTKEEKQTEPLGWADYKIGTNQGESCSNKRPHSGENLQAVKKQCNSTTKKSKAKLAPTTPTKDPQSLAAKNRRERISERLKALQELVPNGTKVDLVTMLEKAIGYVKFLQLQVKVLATDDFWPVQGGKAPDLSQVKNCIDAILSSSQRDTTSSSK